MRPRLRRDIRAAAMHASASLTCPKCGSPDVSASLLCCKHAGYSVLDAGCWMLGAGRGGYATDCAHELRFRPALVHNIDC